LKESICSKTLVIAPKKRFKYSNFGFSILGQIIEEVSGLSYKEYVTKNIIDKLGLKKTWTDLDRENLKYLAIGYSRPIRGKKISPFRQIETGTYASAAGLISNVPDLAKFLTSFSSEKLLKRKSMKEMLTRQKLKTGINGMWYCLGIRSYDFKKRHLIGHSGGFTGFITDIKLDDKNDIGVIVLSNSQRCNSSLLVNNIFEFIYYFLDGKKYLKNSGKSGLKKYQGLYRGRWADELIIEINGYLIDIDPEFFSPIHGMNILNPIGKNEFLIEGEDNHDSFGEKAHFVLDKKGKLARLVYGATYTVKEK
jgi:D-alanyl-D-alanine carboxypeptidase